MACHLQFGESRPRQGEEAARFTPWRPKIPKGETPTAGTPATTITTMSCAYFTLFIPSREKKTGGETG